MNRQLRNRLLIGLAVACLLLFAAGGVAAFMSRNDTICSDGKSPLRERSLGLGQMQYLCHDGELVTKP